MNIKKLESEMIGKYYDTDMAFKYAAIHGGFTVKMQDRRQKKTKTERGVKKMTYEELGKMIIALCNELYDNAVDEKETEETSITLGAEIGGTHNIEITIEKREIE